MNEMFQIVEQLGACIATESCLAVGDPQFQEFLLNRHSRELVSLHRVDTVASENVRNLSAHPFKSQRRPLRSRPRSHKIYDDHSCSSAMRYGKCKVRMLERRVD